MDRCLQWHESTLDRWLRRTIESPRQRVTIVAYEVAYCDFDLHDDVTDSRVMNASTILMV